MSTGQYPLLINQPLSHSVILPPPLCPLENTNKSSAKFAKRNNTPQFSSVVWAKPESTMSNFRKPSSSSRSLNVSPKSSPSPCVSLPRSLDLPPLPVFLTSSPPVRIVHESNESSFYRFRRPYCSSSVLLAAAGWPPLFPLDWIVINSSWLLWTGRRDAPYRRR